MICKIEYKKEPANENISNQRSQDCSYDDCIRVIVGRADRIQQFLRKRNDVLAIKIMVRDANA